MSGRAQGLLRVLQRVCATHCEDPAENILDHAGAAGKPSARPQLPAPLLREGQAPRTASLSLKLHTVLPACKPIRIVLQINLVQQGKSQFQVRKPKQNQK